MLNEEKIRIMTGIAMFEKKAGRDILPASRYFKSDYVGGRMIRSFIFYTFSSMLCLALWVLYQMEDIMSTMDVTALLASAKHVALFYAAGLLVYLAVTYWIYSRRYERASKGMKIYQAKLRRLEKLACDLSEDIRAGDELYVIRGGNLGHANQGVRYTAGPPARYYDPVGSISTGLAHQEVGLLRDNIIGR